MGRRTVTECDGCGGIPNGDDYPWLVVCRGEAHDNSAFCCSVYCTNVVLRQWDAPMSSLNPEVRAKADEEVALFRPRPDGDGEKGRPDPPPEIRLVRASRREVLERLAEQVEPLMAAWSEATAQGVPAGFEAVNMQILTLYTMTSAVNAPDIILPVQGDE